VPHWRVDSLFFSSNPKGAQRGPIQNLVTASFF
jgi:hypothetical protein